MTTHKQIRQAIFPALEAEKSLALVGNQLFFTPIHHIARCITFERSQRSESFRLIWHVNHLFGSLHMHSLIWGRYVSSHEKGYAWYWDSPHIADELCNAITQVALPALARVKSIDDYIILVNMLDEDQWKPWDKIKKSPSCEMVATWRNQGYPKRFIASHVLMEIALGRMEKAKEFCAERSSWASRKKPSEIGDDLVHVLSTIKPLLDRDDRKGLASLLHGYEREKIVHHKVEKIWQPTPFPLEEMG